jgi:WhiB family redox-sensing transcriptional regulator
MDERVVPLRHPANAWRETTGSTGSTDVSWMADARCRGLETALFYPSEESHADAALAICAKCSVREPCLRYALDEREQFGIWGGTTERQRRSLRRRGAARRETA